MTPPACVRATMVDGKWRVVVQRFRFGGTPIFVWYDETGTAYMVHSDHTRMVDASNGLVVGHPAECVAREYAESVRGNAD